MAQRRRKSTARVIEDKVSGVKKHKHSDGVLRYFGLCILDFVVSLTTIFMDNNS